MKVAILAGGLGTRLGEHARDLPKSMVPIGDRFTMGARTAALAVRRYFKFETVIPSHYASFPMVAADANEFVSALAGHDSKVLVPRPGTAVEL